MTTAYNLTDTVIQFCNRSSSTSTSIFITWSVFESSSWKDLSISVAIDVYNHYMSEVDIENQCWAAFTTFWKQNTHYWKSLFYWLLDITLVNSYLLAQTTSRTIKEKSRHHHDH